MADDRTHVARTWNARLAAAQRTNGSIRNNYGKKTFGVTSLRVL